MDINLIIGINYDLGIMVILSVGIVTAGVAFMYFVKNA